MKRILFCDLDGTLRRPLNGKTFAKHPKDYEIIPGTLDVLGKAIADGWQVHGISNQGGVATGKKSLEACVSEMFYSMKLFPHLTSILFCPDFEGQKCLEVYRTNIYYINELANISKEFPELVGSFRKPKPGMLKIILKRHKTTSPGQCLMVGDREEDKKAAENANIPFTWAIDWRN